MANRENMEGVTDFIFLGSKITVDSDSSHEIKRHLLLGRKAMTNLDSILKSRDIAFLTKLVEAMLFPAVMCKLEHKEGWAPKNWCFQTEVLKKTLESPLDSKKIKTVSPKGNQHWIFHGKDWCWSWNCNTLATWCKELTPLKRPWCWEILKEGADHSPRAKWE